MAHVAPHWNARDGTTTTSDKRVRDQLSLALATAQATAQEKRIAGAIALVCLVVFVVAVPFVRVPLPRVPAFIPAYQTALFFVDLITAALLIDQCLRLRSGSLLVLASGYLFDALMIVSHSLSFPGAFAAAGLIGGGAQTTAWLYVFWHGGFPLFVMAYALLRGSDARLRHWLGPRLGLAAGVVVGAIVVLCVGLTLLATAGHDLRPVVMKGNNYSMLVSKGVSPAVWVMTLIALAMLWQRNIRVIDLWLMLVMWVWLFDIALSAVLGASRFDLGFYAGRMFGLIAAGFLLVVLFVEMARLYTGAIGDLVSAREKLSEAPQADTPAPQAMPAALPTRQHGGVDSFVREQNITHYRKLLDSKTLDAARRRTIQQMLDIEEGSKNRPRG